MSRVGDQLKKNSAAVSTVNSRVNTVSTAEKKDNDKREKEVKGVNEKIQLLTLLPLLVKPTFTIPYTATPPPPGSPPGTPPTIDTTKPVTVPADSASTLNALLPLLLIGGLGGSGGLGSSSDGTMDSGSLLILALALSGGIK
jgi:hypothetical protein